MRAHLEGYYRALSQKPGSIPIPTSRSPKTLDLTPLVHRSPQVFVSPHPLLSAGAQCSPGGDSVAACVLGVCLWSRCPGLPPELGGQQVGPRGSHSSWEAPWSCPAPPLRPRLRLASAGSLGSSSRAMADLDHSACSWFLELLRRWEVRGRRPQQPVRLWGWACVRVVPELSLCPLVFSVPKCLCLFG